MAELFDQSFIEAQKFNNEIVEEFRNNDGKVGGQFYGIDLLLLTTTGAKSGRPRLSPLAYFVIDDRVLLVGTFAGAPRDPGWAHNMRAHPQVRIERGTEIYDATARELSADDRHTVYTKLMELSPLFGEYQAKTSRVIPVFEISRS